jgi:hypothetical protein
MNDSTPQADLLSWNGQQYRMAEVLRQAKMGPHVTIPVAVMIGPDGPQAVSHGQLWDADHPDNFPVFYKHEGKYVCLLGHASYNRQAQDPKNKGAIKGRLISGPMLKKTREQPPSRFERPSEFSAAELQMGQLPPRRRYVDRDDGNVRNEIRVRDERPGNRDNSTAWTPRRDFQNR